MSGGTCTCGCCSTTPVSRGDGTNRPWLQAVAYRLGTYATFRQAIVDALSRTPELAALASRASDDYTMTLVELWATVADVLTFYQERIANEAFIRTATERDSVLRMVGLLGYQLAPGAAATGEVAFTLEARTTALVPVGSRVQSVPGEGEQPQKFETLAPLEARASLNRLRIFPRPQPGLQVPGSPPLFGALVAPDAAALTGVSALSKGDRVITYRSDSVRTAVVTGLQATDDGLMLTCSNVLVVSAFSAIESHDFVEGAYKLGRTFQLFGVDVPPSHVIPQEVPSTTPKRYYLADGSTDYSLHGDGTAQDEISLDTRYDNLRPGTRLLGVSSKGARRAYPFVVVDAREVTAQRRAVVSGGGSSVVATGRATRLQLQSLTSRSLADLVGNGDIRDLVFHELLGDSLRMWFHWFRPRITSGDVYVPGRRSGWSTLEVGRTVDKGTYKAGIDLDVADVAVGRRVLLADASGVAAVGGTVSGVALVGANVHLSPAGTDPVLEMLQLGLTSSPVTVLVSRRLPSVVNLTGASELVATIGAFPPQTLQLQPAGSGRAQVAAAVQAAIRTALPSEPAFASARVFEIDGAIAVAAGLPGVRVHLAASSRDADTVDTLGFGPTERLHLDGRLSGPIASSPSPFSGTVLKTVGFEPSEAVPVSGVTTSAAAVAAALAVVDLRTATTDDGRVLVLPPLPLHPPRSFLQISLAVDGPLALDAATAVLLGNVAPVSHGESVRPEVLGDGNASRPFQRFSVRKKPVTFVPAARPGGVQSSLEVFVNDVRWREVPTLYGAFPSDEVYVTRLADDGTMSVQFGDGITGARLPSGRDNVVARYRQGIGPAGRVAARTLTSLLDRPTGVKSVINPRSADGGADPESVQRVRTTAPGSVRTFGRAVALRDFEDGALTSGEVSKALATWVWNGEHRAIHVTVAPQGGGAFSADALTRLATTFANQRDPNIPLLLDNYRPVPIVVEGTLLVDDRYAVSDVLSAARAAMLDALSFERRRFAQPVFLSEVVAVLQQVPGVTAVDVDTLDLKNQDAAFRLAHGVTDALGQPQPRLLMLPPRPMGLHVVSPAELAYLENPIDDLRLRTTGGGMR